MLKGKFHEEVISLEKIKTLVTQIEYTILPESITANDSICNSKCVSKCPQGIYIPEELKKVHAILGRREKVEKHFKKNK